MDTQANFTFWKTMWGFAIPFFAMVSVSWGRNFTRGRRCLLRLHTHQEWSAASGFTTTYAIQGALAAVMGAFVCCGLIWKGYEIRKWQGMPVSNWAQ